MYVADMLQMILQFHPYLGPTANQIGENTQAAQLEVEKRYPMSKILTPVNDIIHPH